jgi:hypothetical protein
MRLRWAALAVVLAFSALMPRGVLAQASQPPAGQRRAGSLGQNYPNPFNPDTRFQFVVGDSTNCAGERHRVTVRIYNLLAQVVAVPVIQGSTATVAGMTPIENLELECGTYTAYWNGKFMNTNRDAASGVYMYRLEVDGRTAYIRKMFFGK